MAKLLTPEEIPSTYGKQAVWIEYHLSSYRYNAELAMYKCKNDMLICFVMSKTPSASWLDRDLYNVEWRCWDRRPSEADVDTTPWKKPEITVSTGGNYENR